MPRRPREWGSRALFIAVLFWIAGAFLFATRLSTLKHAPINSADAPELSIGEQKHAKYVDLLSIFWPAVSGASPSDNIFIYLIN